jgi:hypothetical protein
MPLDSAERAVATAKPTEMMCALPSCTNPLTGRQTKYCRPGHKTADYDRLHPRAPLLVIAEQPPTPESRRNEGKAKAASNHAPDLELARRLALQMLAARGVGTISDLREYAAAKGHELPWSLPWTASVFLPSSKRAAWFEPTGERVATRHLRGNARKVNQYRLTAEGVNAWRELR